MAAAVDTNDIAYWLIWLQVITVFGDSALVEEGLCCLCLSAIVIDNQS